MQPTTTPRFLWYLLIIALCMSYTAEAQVIFPMQSNWKYLDNGSNQGTAWRAATFNDATWKSGNGKLGYGNGDETTILSYGSSSSNKFITSYFRRTFNISGLSNYTGFKMDYYRDDGLVIYVNGTEVKRDNIGSGTITYTTTASDASDDGMGLQTTTIAASYFVEGANTIAVELHQTSKSSSDIAFDLSLTGQGNGTSATITRGPYLQMGNQQSVIIRWRTDVATDSKVKYGDAPGNLSQSVADAVVTKEHEVRITGLQGDTRYYYSIGTGSAVLEGTDRNYFQTAPPVAVSRKIRIAAYGDCGNNSSNQVKVRNAYLSFSGQQHTDLWLLLGDNAYDDGTDAEYQSNFFNIYKDNLLKNTLLFPALGNHDYANSSSRQDDHNIPYLSVFSLPKGGECGGLASGKEEYYSFDYGDIHFISLDAYGKEGGKRMSDTSSPQIVWLKKDLAANQRKWTIAYWHHPPYTMGSHNSDTESDLAVIRSNMIRILERYGVDLILNGHSHDYERSYLLKGHFGMENTFSFNNHAVSNSSAKYDGSSNSCPYLSTAAKVNHGTVYVVAGSAGQVGGTSGSFPHAAMFYSNATVGGSLAIEIEGNRLDAKFVAADNTIKDQFTILKDVNKRTVLTAGSGQPITLAASWIGNYKWSTGANSRSITVTPPTGTTQYLVTDQSGAAAKCITDTFIVNAGNSVNARNMISEETGSKSPIGFELKVFPNPSTNNTVQVLIERHYSQQLRLRVSSTDGQVIRTQVIPAAHKNYTESLPLPGGIYIVEVANEKGERKTEKVLVR